MEMEGSFPYSNDPTSDPYNDPTHSVAWVRERTIPTELQSLFGEVSSNFCGYRVPRGQRGRSPTAVFSAFYTGKLSP
jgi:hypothetical protein